jgi:hypothetical protein
LLTQTTLRLAVSIVTKFLVPMCVIGYRHAKPEPDDTHIRSPLTSLTKSAFA